MGPRPGGRGITMGKQNRQDRDAASMGPRPGGRGILANRYHVCARIARLQWGRAPGGAEFAHR